MRIRASLGALVLLAAAGTALSQERDEFGLKPDAPHDDELVLPDPVLDRSWPMPEPGEGAPPAAVAPDEDEVDPFAEEDRRPAPPPEDEHGEDVDEEEAPAPPAAAPDPDPYFAPVLEPEVDEPAGLREEDEPSPLDLDDQRFRDEAGDDGDW